MVGAGAFGREVYSWALQCQDNGSIWTIKGFLDSKKDMLKNFDYEVPVLASVEDYKIQEDDVFVCAFGDPEIKEKYSSRLIRKGAKFINIIHPSVIFGKNVKLGRGNIFCPFVVISSDAEIGNYVSVNLHTNIGHDVSIKDWTQISPSCSINGGVEIGKSVFIGSSSTILPHIKIKDGSKISAGSLVNKNVGKNTIVFGVPAAKMNLPK